MTLQAATSELAGVILGIPQCVFCIGKVAEAGALRSLEIFRQPTAEKCANEVLVWIGPAKLTKSVMS